MATHVKKASSASRASTSPKPRYPDPRALPLLNDLRHNRPARAVEILCDAVWLAPLNQRKSTGSHDQSISGQPRINLPDPRRPRPCARHGLHYI